MKRMRVVRSTRRRVALLVLSALVVGTTIWGNTMGTRVEEPPHEVLQRDGDFELRVYAPRIVAETRMDGTRESAVSEGFGRLAGYIFGGNRGREKIAMTAPVAQRAAPARIAMTAPVGQSQVNGAWVVTFTMPAAFTLATLPTPDDARVLLRAEPAQRVAVVRFSGRSTAERIDAETARLAAWVRTRGWHSLAATEVNRYDPPWTLPFLRRNEIWMTVDPS